MELKLSMKDKSITVHENGLIAIEYHDSRYTYIPFEKDEIDTLLKFKPIVDEFLRICAELDSEERLTLKLMEE